jgi:TRAP-type C4-dicarboxylate transport system permease small subunit
MALLDKFNTIVSRITWALSVVGMVGLVFLSIAITADVFMRYVFNSPIAGVRDMLSLFIAVCVGFMMPVLLLKEGNIAVEFINLAVGDRIGGLLQIIANTVTAVIFLLFANETYKAAVYMQANNEVTQVLGIWLGPWWIVVAICFLFSVVAALVPIGNGIRAFVNPPRKTAGSGGAA